MKDVNTLELSKVARIFLRSLSKLMSVNGWAPFVPQSIFSRTPKPPELEIWTLSDQCPASNNVWTVEHPGNLRIGGFCHNSAPTYRHDSTALKTLHWGASNVSLSMRLRHTLYSTPEQGTLQSEAVSISTTNCTVTELHSHSATQEVASHIFTCFARPMRPLRKDAWLGRCSHKV